MLEETLLDYSFLLFVLENNGLCPLSSLYGNALDNVLSRTVSTRCTLPTRGIGLRLPFLVPSVGQYVAARPAACQG
jgi:hypothetical protein